jgi:hypothetical protein
LHSLLSFTGLIPGHAGVGSLVLLGQAANLKARTGRANLSRGPSKEDYLIFLENVLIKLILTNGHIDKLLA